MLRRLGKTALATSYPSLIPQIVFGFCPYPRWPISEEDDNARSCWLYWRPRQLCHKSRFSSGLDCPTGAYGTVERVGLFSELSSLGVLAPAINGIVCIYTGLAADRGITITPEWQRRDEPSHPSRRLFRLSASTPQPERHQ
jgi:hypothetical protein